MSELTAAEVVARTALPVLEFGRGWMLDSGTLDKAGGLGFSIDTPLSFWVSGRAGVLGDGDPWKAAAAIAFMDPGRVREYWEERPSELSATDAAREYSEAAQTWGRVTLGSMRDSECLDLAALCNKIASAAQPSMGMLFAGWREMEQPDDDPAGAATVAMHVVRELRGGAHISAVYAAGIGPLGAIISTDDAVRGGIRGAQRFGWKGPYPAPDPEARELAEDLTSSILEPVYEAALDGAERARFVELVLMAREAMD